MSEVQLSLTAPDPLAAEVEWTRKNPEAWHCIVRWAREDRARGFDPSTRLYCCLLRHAHFATRLGLSPMAGDTVVVNDRMSAGFARLLNRLDPDLRVPERRAYVDSWPGAGRQVSP